DYDNDGRIDLYVTALDANHLFRNAGGGKFVDVTRAAGVADGGFSTSAAWFDYDKDGRLDLFIGHYVEWSPQKDLFCTVDGTHKSYCTPESYTGVSPTLFRNRGDGTFENVTARAGLRIRPARRSASPFSTSTTTAGRICSWPTTRSRTGCIATSTTARSPMSRCRPASPSTRRASRAPAWASTPPTTIARVATVW